MDLWATMELSYWLLTGVDYLNIFSKHCQNSHEGMDCKDFVEATICKEPALNWVVKTKTTFLYERDQMISIRTTGFINDFPSWTMANISSNFCGLSWRNQCSGALKMGVTVNEASEISMVFRLVLWGDIFGGVREFGVKAFKFSWGCPNQGNPLKFGAAYPLVIFGCECFKIFLKTFFSTPKKLNENNSQNI